MHIASEAFFAENEGRWLSRHRYRAGYAAQTGRAGLISLCRAAAGPGLSRRGARGTTGPGVAPLRESSPSGDKGLPARSCPHHKAPPGPLRAPPPRERPAATGGCPPVGAAPPTTQTMPKKKKGKKGKKEKKKTPHQLQVEALTKACDEAERIYRDTRDLNARLERMRSGAWR